MAENTPETSLRELGLTDQRVKELTSKPALAPVVKNLLAIKEKFSVTTTTTEVGTLLDELSASKIKEQDTILFLAKYILDGKVRRVQLQAALRYFQNAKGAIDTQDFESKCGVGIVVSQETITEAVRAILDAKAEALASTGWKVQGAVIGEVKKVSALQWADGKDVNAIITQELTARLGAQQEKAAKTPAATPAAGTTVSVSETDLDPNQYKELREVHMKKLKEGGIDIFPHKYHVTHSIAEFRKEFDSLKKGEQSKEKTVKVVGRIIMRRESSAKLLFFDITQEGSNLQVLANFSLYGNKEQWATLIDLLRRGDTIGVEGYPGRSNTEELSIIPTLVTLLSPCYHMLPKSGTLKEMETRYRKRYLDMLVNPNVVQTFTLRSKIIQYIRRYFDSKGFLEVETPTMNLLAGGATAKPFVTYHNDLGVNLFMRVAPELYLKQLIIGGMHKVYEIGKNYRNEGIDMTHNPEFTAIEAYLAFADYEDWIRMTEELISSLVFELHGKYVIDYHPSSEEPDKVYHLDFTPPFRRVPMIPTLEAKTGEKFPTDLTSPEANAFFVALCKRLEVECDPPHTTARLIDALVGEYIESDLINPGFITEQPQLMCPLAKYHRNHPGLTERFELFVAKKEICNSYTELNDPAIQRRLFQGQVADREAGDDEAQPIDEDYCTAMEFGLPPTGGWGMGIDRLTMMLTDHNNIKEVILFPAMRPLAEQVAAQQQQLSQVGPITGVPFSSAK